MTKRGNRRQRARYKAEQQRQSHAPSSAEAWSAVRAIENVLKRYNPHDVLVAISVTELWPANIASVVRFRLLYSVAMAMKDDDYADLELSTYGTYRSFMTDLLNELPSFPMLDDYVPEEDWGDTRVIIERKEYKIFYGCVIERINDFIDVFKIIFANNAKALNDLVTTVAFQNSILNEVDISRTDFARSSPGFIEVPPVDFWHQAKDAIFTALAILKTKPLSSALSPKLGVTSPPKSLREFGNSIFEGKIMPAPTVITKQGPMPISIRNMAACVCDYWGYKMQSLQTPDASRDLGKYISQRLNEGVFSSGNFFIMTRAGWRSPPIAGIISTKDDIYLLPFFSSSEFVEELKVFRRAFAKLPNKAPSGLFLQREKVRHSLSILKTELRFR